LQGVEGVDLPDDHLRLGGPWSRTTRCTSAAALPLLDCQPGGAQTSLASRQQSI
jgi:hypothetical protein